MPDSELPRSWLRDRADLLKRMRTCILTGSPARINLSVAKHSIFTHCLRQLVFNADEEFKGKSLPLVFSDCSEPPPFPVGCFAPPQRVFGPEHAAALSLGLMSFRHPELDYLVDIYACRNLEIVMQQSMADEEAYAFGQAVRLLDAPEFEGGVIDVYHTGLEPMVVGFYRGVVEVLRRRMESKRRRDFSVRPKYFRAKGTKTHLTADSPGAKREDYIACDEWMLP